MTRALSYISVIIFLFAIACESKPAVKEVMVSDTSIEKIEPDSNNTAVIEMGATAKNSLDVIGKYKGVLPCADCEGIETTIELKADSTYNREMKYLGKKDNLFTASGKWTWVSEFVISLGSIKEGPNRYFVAEGKLLQLDMSGKKISGPLAEKYELKKQ